jgi:hypothetical protein
MAMLYGLQLLQGLSLAVLPSREAVRMPSMNYSSGRTRSLSHIDPRAPYSQPALNLPRPQ